MFGNYLKDKFQLTHFGLISVTYQIQNKQDLLFIIILALYRPYSPKIICIITIIDKSVFTSRVHSRTHYIIQTKIKSKGK